MKWKNRKPGVVVLGRRGVVVLVVGMALLVFVFFLFGVHAGRHIDVMPEKIAWGIPKKVLSALNLLPPKGEHLSMYQPVSEEVRPRDDVASQSTAGQVQSGYPVIKESETNKVVETREDKVVRPLTEEGRTTGEDKEGVRSLTARALYKVQVVSLQDKKRAEEVASLVREQGYRASVVSVDITGKGRWYRVFADGFMSEDKAKEAAAVLMKKVKGQCIVMKAN
ncbi:MAG: SPOR domain-containing protein [Syntrophales bacterium]|nr:SPOR domain-containing protein [Syntrophales bacterium]